jgi:hypothetical protein
MPEDVQNGPFWESILNLLDQGVCPLPDASMRGDLRGKELDSLFLQDLFGSDPGTEEYRNIDVAVNKDNGVFEKDHRV